MKSVKIKEYSEDTPHHLYKELAEQIFSPIEDVDLCLKLKYELYQSKLTYLYHLQEQCFRAINSSVSSEKEGYTQGDLIFIQTAIDLTKEFIRQSVLDSIKNSLHFIPSL